MAQEPRQIRVLNELAAAGGADVSPYQVTLIPEDGSDDAERGPLVLPYNPDGYELVFGSSWEPRNAAGTASEMNASDWQYSQPDILTMMITLQPDDPDLNDEILTTLRVWTVIPSQKAQRPPTIRVQQGTGKRAHPFTGHIDMVNARVRETDALGRIRTMDLEIRFVRNQIGVM